MKGLARLTPTKNFLRWRGRGFFPSYLARTSPHCRVTSQGRGFEVWASCPSCSENQTCPGRSRHPTTLQAAPPAFSNLPGPSRGPSPPTPRFGTVHRAGSGVVIKSVQVLVKQDPRWKEMSAARIIGKHGIKQRPSEACAAGRLHG